MYVAIQQNKYMDIPTLQYNILISGHHFLFRVYLVEGECRILNF